MPEWRLTRLRGEFCVAWDEEHDGRTVRRRYRLGTTDKAEAARLAPARYTALTRPAGTTVAELWTGYVKDKEGRAVLETMTHTWKALEARFGSMDGETITIADCRAHTAERRGAGKSDGTIHTELGHLRTVLKWAEAHRLIDRAPAIERPSKPEPKRDYLTRQQVTKLIAAAHAPHIALAIRLMIGTGARVTAALELTWDRVDFERRLIHLRNPFDKARRKGRATVPMNDGLERSLLEARDAALSAYVIEWAGGPVRSIKKGIKAAGKAAGIPEVSPHIFRHSAAVWQAEAGVSMKEIADFLGHTDSRITDRVYARWTPDRLRTAAAALELDEPEAAQVR